MQSLVHKGTVDDRIGDYGHLVVDECHHLSAQSFELVARRAKAKFVDRLVRHVDAERWPSPDHLHAMRPGAASRRCEKAGCGQAIHSPGICPPDRISLTVEPEDDPRLEFQRLCEALRNDDSRNEMICADVLGAVHEGRSPLLLTERIEHVQCLAQRLSAEIPHVITLQGGMGQKELQGALDSLAHISDDAAALFWHGALHRRRIRRSAPGHLVPDYACFVARNDLSVCGAPASSP